MAVGQYLDVAGLAAEPAAARRVAKLKGGAYTVEGPLVIGASLAGASLDRQALLSRYGDPLGEAFQLRDDLNDREGGHGATPGTDLDAHFGERYKQKESEDCPTNPNGGTR